MLLIQCLLIAAAFAADPWTESYRAAARLMDTGAYAEAEDVLEKLEKQARAANDPVGVAYALHGIAYSLHQMGRAGEAEQAYRRALAAIASGPPALEMLRLRVWNNLAMLYLNTGQHGAAGRTLRELGRSDLQRLPEEDAQYRHNLAVLQFRLGRTAEAEETARQGVAHAARTIGEENRFTAGLFHVLGLLVAANGRPAEALQYHERSQAILERLFGPDSLWVARSLVAASDACLRLGRAAQAEAAADRAGRILEGRLGPEHPAMGRALMARAAALRRLKRNAEARRLEKRARSILARIERPGAAAWVVDVSALR